MGDVHRVVSEPFAPYLRGMRRPWTFPRPSDTGAQLERAGFGERRCWLDFVQVQAANPAAYLSAVVLGAHLAALPDELARDFVKFVLGGTPRPLVLGYVRLNISASVS